LMLPIRRHTSGQLPQHMARQVGIWTWGRMGKYWS
jgi:hypothetical protein